MISTWSSFLPRALGALAFCLGPGAAWACAAGDDDYLLDWNAPAASWPSVGALSDTVVVPRVGTSIGDTDARELTVSVDITGATNRIRSNYPNVSTVITGGYGNSQRSLSIKQDLGTTAESNVIRLTFDRPIYDLSFELFDIDASRYTGNGFVDFITVTGFDAESGLARSADQTRTPRPSNVTSSVTLSSPDPDSVRGLTNGGNDSQGVGNVRFDFPDQVTQVDIAYQNGINGTPTTQGMALYDLSFCTDPADVVVSKRVLFATRTSGLCANSDASQLAAIPGQCMKYHLDAENVGGETAVGVSLTDRLPAGLIFVAAENLSFDDSDPTFSLAAPPPGTDCSVTTCDIELRNTRLTEGASGRLRVVVLID